MSSSASPPRSLPFRILRFAARAVGLLLLGVLLLVTAVLASLDTPPAKRLAVKQLNHILASQFKGHVAVTRLGHLSIFGVRGVDAEVKAIDGESVLLVRGAAARISPLVVLKGALFGKGDRKIRVDAVTLDAVDADIDSTADGSLKLVSAFDPVTPSPPAKPGTRGIAIDLADVRLTHAWVHGVVTGVPPVDATVDQLAAAFFTGSDKTKLDVTRLTLQANGLPAGMTAHGVIAAHLLLPAASDQPMQVTGALDGGIGQIPLLAQVALDGEKLDAVLNVPDVSPEDVRGSVEGVPVYQTVGAHAEAHGVLENLAIALHARLGKGSVDLKGIVHAKGALGGELTLLAEHVDAETFSKTGPVTDVGARIVAVAATEPDKTLAGHASIDIPVGSAAGQVVPHTTLQVAGAQRPGKDGGPATITAHAEGIVDEVGAPVALTVDARSKGGVSDVTFGVKADAPQLAEVPRLGDAASGKAQVTLSGKAHIAKEVDLDATVDAGAQGVVAGGARVGDVRVVATAHGTPASPVLAARVVAKNIAASGYTFSRAEVEVAGLLSDVRVAGSARGINTPDVAIRTELAIKPALAIHGAVVDLSRGGQALTVAVDSVTFGPGEVAASGVLVRGAGEPLEASFRSFPGKLVVKAQDKGLDLAKLAFLVGQDKKLGGTLALDVNLDARRDSAYGNVSIDLTKGAFNNVKDADAHVGLTLAGRHLKGQVHATVGDAGSLDLSGLDVHLGGGDVVGKDAWRHAWGRVGLGANVDFTRVAALASLESLHLADVGGRLTMSGDVSRDSLEDKTPEVHLVVRTEGLTATGESMAPIRRPGGPLMVGPATWTISGVDLRSTLVVDGTDSAAEVAFRLVDKLGAIVSVDVKTDPLPFDSLLGGKGDLQARLLAVPISVRVEAPARDVSQLPAIVRPGGLRGVAGATLTFEGSADKPLVDLAVRGKGIQPTAADVKMDGEVSAHYDGAAAVVSADVRSGDAKLLSASVEVRADVRELLAKNATDPAWSASAKASLSRFPLGAVPLLSANQVKGFVSGDLNVNGVHQNGQCDANLTFADLQVGKVKFATGDVRVTLDGQGLNAKTRLANDTSSLDAEAKMGMTWGKELAPTPDGKGLQAKFAAKHFPAAAAAPFASSVVSELSGWLDADASVVLQTGQKPQMSGSVVLSDGVVEATALGETFHGIKAKVTLTQDGVVKLEDTEAHGLSGGFTASGSARLDGTTLLGADLSLDINKGSAIPLDIQGTNLGTVYGNVKVKATGTADGKSLSIAVDVPKFHVDMPESGLPRSPQALGNAAGVHLGVYRDPDRFIVLPVDNAPVTLVAERNAAPAKPPAPSGAVKTDTPPPAQAEAAKAAPASTALEVKIHIGDVQILRGQQVEINLDGNILAKIAAATSVSGQIHIKSGKLQVQGKEFAIEKGTVSFVGDDPSNPEINVTAGWNAPDGTRVFADYIGPVKTGKVTLRSEPPRPKNEIVALILFGTADGSSATPYASKSPSTGTQAGTTVGGFATDGLSKGLDQLTGMNVTAKIDTSDSANPRPEVEVQIAKDISLELAVVIGTPPPGENPDTSYATIDWRFVRNWSLATTFGDEGSTFADIVWQYRY